MAIGAEKWVKKYTRIILGFFVALMALSLVLTYGPGITAKEKDKKGAAGSITIMDQPVEISWKEWSDAKWTARTMASLRGMLWASDKSQYCGKLVIYRHFLGNPAFQSGLDVDYYQPRDREFSVAPEWLHEIAWETIILARNADLLNITVSDQEFKAALTRFVEHWNRGRYSPEEYKNFVSRLSGLSLQQFEHVFEQALRIAKMLKIHTDGEFPGVKQIYEGMLKEAKKVRLAYATIDPRDAKYLRRLSPITPDEINQFYKKSAERFRSVETAKIVYVGLNYDDLKDRIKDPDEATLKKYYDDHKADFKDGEKQLTYEESKDKVRDKYKLSKLPEYLKVQEPDGPIWTLWKSIHDRVEKLGLDKMPDEATLKKYYEEHKSDFTEPDFVKARDKVLAKYRESQRNFDKVLAEVEAALRNAPGDLKFKISTTIPFTRPQAAAIKKEEGLGEKSTMDTWAFDPKTKDAMLSKPDVKSEKGAFIYLMQKREESKRLPKTKQIEAEIFGMLREQQLESKVSKEVEDIVAVINREPTDDEARRYYEAHLDEFLDDKKQPKKFEAAKFDAKKRVRELRSTKADEFSGLVDARRKYRLELSTTNYFSPVEEHERGMGPAGENIGIDDAQLAGTVKRSAQQLTEVGKATRDRATRDRNKSVYVVSVLMDFFYPPVTDVEDKVDQARQVEIQKKRSREKITYVQFLIKDAKRKDNTKEGPETPEAPEGPPDSQPIEDQ